MSKKIHFGKYAILQPVKYSLKEEPDITWTFRPPTSADDLEMTKFLNRGKITMGFEGTVREAPPTWLEICHRELAVTFGGSTLAYEDGTPVLSDKATIQEVEAIVRLMDPKLVQELWEALGAHVPGWGVSKPKPIDNTDGEIGGVEEVADPKAPSSPRSKSTSKTTSQPVEATTPS